jgi:hypothetical protein
MHDLLERSDLALTPDDPSWWFSHGLERHAKRGSDALAVSAPVDLRRSQISDECARSNLRWLQLMREAARRGIHVRWNLTAFDGDPATLFHISAPSETELSAEIAGTWRSQFVFGRLYWRFGGDFLMVKDRRRSDNEKVVIVLEDPWQIDHFRKWGEVGDLRGLTQEAKDFLDELLELDLALRCGDFFIMLPYRMTFWPVPNYLIS